MTLTELINQAKRYVWRPESEVLRIHQDYLWGYNPDIGQFNCHWRDDKQAWCYSWNQEPCDITHCKAIDYPHTDITAKLIAALEVAVNFIEADVAYSGEDGNPQAHEAKKIGEHA